MRKILFAIILFCSPSLFAQAKWTAAITSKSRENFELTVGVVYSNGTQKIEQEYRLSGADVDAQLGSRIQSQLIALGKLDLLIDAPGMPYAIGPYVEPVTPAPQPQAVTVEDLARAAFLAALRHYRAVKIACEYGLLRIDSQEMADATDALVKAFKIEYVEMLLQ